MNINLPHHILMKLLIESETFREYVLSNCIHQEPIKGIGYYRELVRTHFPDFKEKQKIPAIKWIRELSRDNADMLQLFAGHGYESYNPKSYYDPIATAAHVLGLASAKRFVESC